MEKKPSQNDTEIHNPEINNTGTNSFEGVPDDVVFVIFPFLGLQDMGNLASVNREFRRIITNAFTNPNMYTAYPGMFEALCKFWHENRVAFETKPTEEKINAIRKAFPNVPINFAGANLREANLVKANLTGANLGDANWGGTNLTGANFREADLRGADLYGADLRGADLYGANLTHASLWFAELIGANLTGANLTGADLSYAILGGANLRGANLKGANLTGADFTNSNFFDCKLSTETTLDSIKINSTALLSVFIDSRNPTKAITNISSLNDEMIRTFKLLLPHAEIKELELLMEDVKRCLSVDTANFLFFGQTEKKASILKLISDEIAKKQASQKMECKEPTQNAAISEKPKQNANTIDSTLELPNQSENTISFNP